MLQQALALSLSQQDDKSSGGGGSVPKMPDLSAMTEEEQLNYALQMSMAAHASAAQLASETSTTPGSTSTGTTTVATDKPSTGSVDDTEMKDVKTHLV